MVVLSLLLLELEIHLTQRGSIPLGGLSLMEGASTILLRLTWPQHWEKRVLGVGKGDRGPPGPEDQAAELLILEHSWASIGKQYSQFSFRHQFTVVETEPSPHRCFFHFISFSKLFRSCYFLTRAWVPSLSSSQRCRSIHSLPIPFSVSVYSCMFPWNLTQTPKVKCQSTIKAFPNIQ